MLKSIFSNPTTDNLDNPKNLSFPDYRGFPVPAEKNGFQICNLNAKKRLLRKEKDVFFICALCIASVGVTPCIFPTFTIA